jgi:cytochrome c oxidase subunit 1
MTGRMMDSKIGWISFWGIQIGFNGTFMAMFYVGLQGMPRRVADYSPLFAGGNFVASISAFLLGASVILYFYNVIYSWKAGPIAEQNPWGAKTLEWTVPTPVPLENFEKIPVVTSGPYNYGEPVTPSAVPIPNVEAGPALG